MKTFKTPKKTELPLFQIERKKYNKRTQSWETLPPQDYLEVKYRLIWFREEKPDWGIETEIWQYSPQAAIVKATIRDASSRVVAQAHKYEEYVPAQGTKGATNYQEASGFPDFLEKAETSAIGRALGFLGYGTQFAQELDGEAERERLADSPVDQKKPPITDPKKPEGNPDAAVKRSKAVGDAAVKAGWDKTKEVIPYLKHRFGVDHPQYLTDDQAAEMILTLANVKFHDAMKGAVK